MTSKPLPKWATAILHVSILVVTGIAGATQLPSVATALGLGANAKEVALAVAGAGWVCTYFLKSPLILGWLSLHDPEDVANAADEAVNLVCLADEAANLVPPPPITKRELP
jgi:hypothetical protein